MGPSFYISAREIDDVIELDVESVIVCFVARFLEIPCKALTFVESKPLPNDSIKSAVYKTGRTLYFKGVAVNQSILEFPTLPFARDKIFGINYAGLCTVIRFLVKSDANFAYLLGTTGNCFKACAEVSKWTDLCENKFLKATIEFMIDPKKISSKNQILDIFNILETQLSLPPIISNVNKRSRETGKDVCDLLKVHPHIEGLDFLLTDLVICCYLNMLVSTDPSIYLDSMAKFPKLFAWFYRIIGRTDIKSTIADIFGDIPDIRRPSDDLVYRSEQPVAKISPKIKVASKASSGRIEDVLLKLSLGNVAPFGNVVQKLPGHLIPRPSEMDLCFSEIIGILPRKRFDRKREQLENIIKPVYALASAWPGSCRVVDFCCGSGYLGVVLRRLLPRCRVALVENKEESLARALPMLRRSSEETNPTGDPAYSPESPRDDAPNVEIYQCNLEHFRERFDVGICLHGCGPATDLVLRKCYQNRASFVVCPCCYGAIKSTDSIKYPRSTSFEKVLSENDYSIMAHAADQTEEGIKQHHLAKRCMTIIDTDRLMEADSHGYKTYLVTMAPPSCTPKNNLLVGVPAESPVSSTLSDLYGD